MLIPLLHLLLAAPLEFPFDKGVRVCDEGAGAATLANQARGVDCQGGAVSCYVDGGWWILAVSATSDGGGGSGAPTNASYITRVAESGLSNETAMGSLGTGLVLNTTTTGSPSIYAGSSCSAGQYATATNASGALTCSTPAGTPGGSSPQVQYNNSGAFGGMSKVQHSGGHLELVPVQSHPTAPSGSLLYSFAANASMPGVQPTVLTNKLGFPVPAGALSQFLNLGSKVECIVPANWNTNTAAVPSASADWQSAGTSVAIAWDAGQALTRYPHLLRRTSAATNNTAGIYRSSGTQASAWMGSGGEGGFLFWARVGFGVAKADQRVGIGMAGISNTPPALLPASNANPDSRVNVAYIGCNADAGTLSACSNDGSGTATCHADLGTDYPCETSSALYDVWLWTPPGNGSVDYYVERLDSAVSPAAGSMTSDLPYNTLLSANALINTGPTNSTATELRFYGMCTMANY